MSVPGCTKHKRADGEATWRSVHCGAQANHWFSSSLLFFPDIIRKMDLSFYSFWHFTESFFHQSNVPVSLLTQDLNLFLTCLDNKLVPVLVLLDLSTAFAGPQYCIWHSWSRHPDWSRSLGKEHWTSSDHIHQKSPNPLHSQSTSYWPLSKTGWGGCMSALGHSEPWLWHCQKINDKGSYLQLVISAFVICECCSLKPLFSVLPETPQLLWYLTLQFQCTMWHVHPPCEWSKCWPLKLKLQQMGSWVKQHLNSFYSQHYYTWKLFHEYTSFSHPPFSTHCMEFFLF